MAKQQQKYQALIGNQNAVADDPRCMSIHIRLTKGEYEAVSQLAAAHGQTRAEYGRLRIVPSNIL